MPHNCQNDWIVTIVLKNSVFQSDVLKSGNFRHVQWPGITSSAANNFKELHSTCRCGRENLPAFLSQEFSTEYTHSRHIRIHKIGLLTTLSHNLLMVNGRFVRLKRYAPAHIARNIPR